MAKTARERATLRGLPFAITFEDVVIPDVCPVLGIPILMPDGTRPGNRAQSPSLDRIIPSLGYVPNNVWVISQRANAIKNDATPDELRRVADVVEAEMRRRGLT